MLIAAKKLYFMRSCSRSCRVRLLAASSLWWDIFSTMLLMDSPADSFTSGDFNSSCMVSETSIRHSKSTGLKLPHSLLQIISMAFSWENADLYTRSLVRASYTSAIATTWAAIGISSPLSPSG